MLLLGEGTGIVSGINEGRGRPFAFGLCICCVWRVCLWNVPGGVCLCGRVGVHVQEGGRTRPQFLMPCTQRASAIITHALRSRARGGV